MGKRNVKAKRTLSSLPKGLVRKNGGGRNGVDPGNPFEMTAKMKRPKHLVHNRPVSKPKSTKHALESLQRRQNTLRSNLKDSKKANTFIDRRIGQFDQEMSQDDKMMARLVKERVRQSTRSSKFRLGDDDDDDNDGDDNDGLLTHKGKKLDPSKSEVMYSDDEDEHGGNLEAVDTELHFGGAGLSSMGGASNPYAPSVATGTDLSQLYGQTRKNELDDLISRRKAMKAVKMEAKETQLDTFEKMDETFGDLSHLLKYRKNEKRPLIPPKPTKEDTEMNEWNADLREMMSKPKRRATDRTKTPEEIAKDDSERLHELETRRLARMNGDFEEDDLSDISLNGDGRKKKKAKRARNPDELDNSDDEDENDNKEGVEVKFTADGKRVTEEDLDADDSGDSDSDAEEEGDASCHPLSEGTLVRGNYRAAEQFDGRENWYEGKIVKVHDETDTSGVTYDVEYDDGDTEFNVVTKNVRPGVEIQVEEKKVDDSKNHEAKLEQLRRKKAKEKARNEMPYVFEAVTTLEGLHELIGRYAHTGKDASTIIKRIHASNSVRLDHRNGERMQNFYDVLLRRFIALGDGIFDSGDGGKELGRYNQLNSITKVMYEMAQDSPDSAGAVWSRRIGVLRSAHDKRLRDAGFVREDEEMEEGEFWTAWPTMGVFLLIRTLGHIFPVTDRRHHVVTPAIILLAQTTAQTPVLSTYDLTMGILCSGLLMEYTKEAKRVVPEALGFIASAIRLFSPDTAGNFTIPSLQTAYNQPFCQSLRDNVSKYDGTTLPPLKLENDFIMNNESPETAVSLLSLCMSLVEKYTLALGDSFSVSAETELLYDVTSAILSLQPKSYPLDLQKKISKTATLIAKLCPVERTPVQRRGRATASEMAIKTLAPRIEDPERYSMSRDKGKKSTQAAIDRTRREFKREHKAITRELRMDGQFIETERRKEQDKTDNKARAKRNKNFNWLEGEVGAMNEQVRQGGGLLKGGGTGLARAKAATGQMGIKKGGKMR